MNEQIKELVELGNGIGGTRITCKGDLQRLFDEYRQRMEEAHNNTPSLYYTYSRKEKQQ